MASIIQIILLLLCGSVFFVKRIHKLVILIITGLCLTPFHITSIPYGNIKYLIPLCVFVSEFKLIKSQLRSFNFISSISFLMVLASIILWINSPHYSGIKGLTLILLFELVYKYFILVMSYVLVINLSDLNPVLRTIKYCLIILTVFGVLNYISKTSYVLELAGNAEMASYFKYADRFRVQSLFYNAFDYGFSCLSCLIVYTFAYNKKMIDKMSFLIVLACGIFGILFCGGRTLILCFIVFGLIFLLLAKKSFLRRLKVLLGIGIISSLSYFFVPVVEEKIGVMLTMFSPDDSAAESSNLDMRTTQYTAVLFYVRDNMLFGRGRDFFLKDLGWGQGGLEGAVDKDLMGLEGVLMGLLLERGIFGVLAYITYYISILIYLCRRRKNDRTLFAASVSLILVFLLFGNATGELFSFYLTLVFTGIFIKIFDIEENNQTKLNYETNKIYNSSTSLQSKIL